MVKTAMLRLGVLLCILAMALPACGQGRRGARTTPPPSAGQTAASPPAPPASGPGSTQYTHGSVTKQLYGEGATGYWLFTPDNPRPTSAPVILFLHGYRGTNPESYGGWIEHLVRRGNIVVYPIFEGSMSDSGDTLIANALAGTRAAIEQLRGGPIRADFDRFAITGHSLGGGMTSQIAARAQSAGLPTPRAIMPVQPGWKGSDTMPTDMLGQIPPSVLMLIAMGGEDQFASSRQGKAIWEATKQIPLDHKRFVIIQSDSHGSPPLVADHSSPVAWRPDYGPQQSGRQVRRVEFLMRLTGMRPNEANALNYWGYYRLFDALTQAAFAGQTIDGVVRDTAMGRWSDGTPVKPLLVSQSP